MAVSDKDKARLRIIRFLSRGAAHASYVPGGRNVLLDGAERGTVSVCAEVLRAATKDGLVEKRAGKLVLSCDGAAYLRRLSAAGDPFQDQHRELEEIRIEMPNGAATVTANLANPRLTSWRGARRRTATRFSPSTSGGPASVCAPTTRAASSSPAWGRTGSRRLLQAGATAEPASPT